MQIEVCTKGKNFQNEVRLQNKTKNYITRFVLNAVTWLDNC